VIHDWGSALGFHWANEHRDRVASITFMEALVGPVPGWDAWPDVARRAFQNLRSDAGEAMVLQNNFFIEKLLPGSIMRPLTEEEMAE
jgi:haloalkane dehalogenase